jgi:hypothetical protein
MSGGGERRLLSLEIRNRTWLSAEEATFNSSNNTK